MYHMAVARHALTRRSKGQRSRSHGCENRHGGTSASGRCGRCDMLPATVVYTINYSKWRYSLSFRKLKNHKYAYCMEFNRKYMLKFL